jgi:hypothetical protein
LCQQKAQRIYDRFGVRPTYAVDYPVSSNRSSYAAIRDIFDSGGCIIGAHLQPWDTPPFTEFLSDLNSFPGNLPRELELAKLARLTDTIEANLGVRPRIYKAGRYGVGPATAEVLEQLGYEIDVSVQPRTDLSLTFGPDFSRCGVDPYWIGSQFRLLEIPMSIGHAGLLGRYGPRLQKFLSRPRIESLHFPGLFARLRLLDRITLTPEGVTLSEQKRLVLAMLRRGHRVFHLTYHAPSLLPGNTPYVQTEADLRQFLDRISGFLEFFLGKLGGIPSTPFEIKEVATKAVQNVRPEYRSSSSQTAEPKLPC